MNRVTITAANTMSHLQKQLDIIANNLANSQTTGYKTKQASFSDMIYQHINNQRNEQKEVGRLTPHGIRQGIGAKIAQIQTNSTQGPTVQTDRQLDFALTKENQYFKVLAGPEEDTKIHYTRDGAFYLSPLGNNEQMLVTSKGNPVLDENDQPIVFYGQPSEIKLSADGMLTYTDDLGNETTYALGVIQADNPNIFVQSGENLVTLPGHLDETVLTNLTGDNRRLIGLKQGALEQSNVNIAEEITNLIQTQRAYQFQARAITLADQMQGLINDIR